MPEPAKKFPEDFEWGVSTSAYQVEEDIHNDWEQAGIKAGKAIEHRRRFNEDLAHMKHMGLKAYRFSIEWARLEPHKGQWQEQELIACLQRIRQLKAAGITPYLTLWHFTQPVWVAKAGGWQNPQTVEHYLNYVSKVLKVLGPEVDDWLTLNEPEVYAVMAYFKGRWPPFGQSRQQMERALGHLLRAHAQAYQLIHQIDPVARVGLAKSLASLKPLRAWHPGDQLAAWAYPQAFNWSLLAALSGQGPTFPFNWSSIPGLAESLDWLGVNYYARYYISLDGRLMTENGRTATYWDRQNASQDLTELLLHSNTYFQKSKIPVLITENGIHDADDSVRPCYLLEHLQALQQARAQGVNIKGYFHWTLVDDFEWAEAYGPKYGLLDRERHWRSSAYLYQQVIQTGQLPQVLAGCTNQK